MFPSFRRRGQTLDVRAPSRPGAWPEDPAGQRLLGNGLLLVSGSLVVATGVVAGLDPRIRAHFGLLWPDASGDPWFTVAVFLSALALIGYIVLQVWDAARARRAGELLAREQEERSVRHWTRLYGLLHVSQLVGQHTDLESVFDGITSMCVESFSADWTSLMQFDASTRELVVRSSSGPGSKPDIIGRRNSLDQGLAGWAAMHRRAVVLGPGTDASDYPGVTLRDATITGSMVAPIIVRNELVGVINVSTRGRGVSYDEEDLRTLEVFAQNAGSYIRHIEHVTWLRQMVDKLREGDEARKDARDHVTV